MGNDVTLQGKAVLATESLEEGTPACDTAAERAASDAIDTSLPTPFQQQWIDDLYKRHAANLLGYVRKSVGSGPPDPEDIVHASFEKLVSLHNPERIENPHAFLWRTAKNILSSD